MQGLAPFGALKRRGYVNAARPLLTNLAAFWELEEASGVRYDAHINHLDLTDNNTVTQAVGKVGNAADFERDNGEWLSLASGINPAVGSWTWAGWLKPESNPATAGFAAKYGAGGNEFILMGHVGILFFDLYGTGGYNEILRVGAFTAGVWHFVVAWLDAAGATINFQVNDGSVTSGALTVTRVAGTAPFTLGRYAAGAEWDGLIDQPGWWARVLTTAEKTWLFNGGAGRSYAEVAAYTG